MRAPTVPCSVDSFLSDDRLDFIHFAAAQAGYSDCAMKGLAYKPRKGDIVLFWSIKTDGRFDPKSLHGSCPVIRGQKWSATKW